MNARRGFTLIELMITIAIAAILITVGIPSFTNTIRNNRVVTEANSFLASIQLARSEAIKRNQTVTICRSVNGTSCGGTDRVYEKGWLLYNDVSDTSFNGNANYATGDTLIRVGEIAAADITIRSNDDGNSWLSFRPTGRLIENNAAIYAICYNGESTAAVPGRQIRIELTGRAAITQMAAGADCTP